MSPSPDPENGAGQSPVAAAPSSQPEPAPDRRDFLKRAACVAIGGACALTPIAIGGYVLLDPVRQIAGAGEWILLTTLEALPFGAGPRLFKVFVERTDAWTRHARSAVGAVFLERIEEQKVRAFQASCPHLGCAVEWRKETHKFFCPCHNSSFAQDGEIMPPSPSARPLDALEVAIRDDGNVWVRFQDFKAGMKEKIPVA